MFYEQLYFQVFYFSRKETINEYVKIQQYEIFLWIQFRKFTIFYALTQNEIC